MFPDEFALYSSYPFDCITAGIHHCYNSVFPGAGNLSVSKAIHEYYQIMQKAIEFGGFQVMLYSHDSQDIVGEFSNQCQIVFGSLGWRSVFTKGIIQHMVQAVFHTPVIPPALLHFFGGHLFICNHIYCLYVITF